MNKILLGLCITSVLLTGCGTEALPKAENTTARASEFLKTCWEKSGMPSEIEDVCLLSNTCLNDEDADTYNAQVDILNTCFDNALDAGFTASIVPTDLVPLLEEYVAETTEN